MTKSVKQFVFRELQMIIYAAIKHRGRRFVLLCSASWYIMCCSTWMLAADQTQNEIQEIKKIEKQLEDGLLPKPPLWTLIHMAAEKEKAEALEVYCSGTQNDIEHWDLVAIIQKGGGLAKYRKRISRLLESRDATVRGFAAVWLADLGGRSYAKNILTLLESENLPDAGGCNKNWDRGHAAVALGILGSREHAKVLARFLHHEDRHLRAGAASGLAWLQANDYEREIASLLQDDDERVVCSTIVALAELGAKQYSDEIGRLVKTIRPDIPETAMMALVTLDAKEQAPHIASLLKDQFKEGGQAAKTLALLGAKKYAPDIADLLNAREPLTRADALVAIGILRANHYTSQVGKCLQDKEDFVRHAAAWSIVMMEAQPNKKEAIKIVKAAQKEHVSPMGSREQGIPRDRLKQLNKRFEELLKTN
ncbi:MAG: HEAT repeat domain-containing protein [Pirellulales bacterium]|nr:HEAT repeat domain-containing protein [Pirellulales bacterium]